jgi:hypothetical protein
LWNCHSSATQIAKLLSKYEKLYGFHRTPLIITHIIFTAIVINLFNLSVATSPFRATAHRNLVICLAALGACSARHESSRRCFRLTQILMQRWGIKINNTRCEDDLAKVANPRKHGHADDDDDGTVERPEKRACRLEGASEGASEPSDGQCLESRIIFQFFAD